MILDVVYNHTGEGNLDGPTYNLKGIDNSTYYSGSGHPADPYLNYSGTGNAMNCSSGATRRVDPGQHALLGPGDARRWLPLRPRVRLVARSGWRDPLRTRRCSTRSRPTQSFRASDSSRSRGTPRGSISSERPFLASAGCSGTIDSATMSAGSFAATRDSSGRSWPASTDRATCSRTPPTKRPDRSKASTTSAHTTGSRFTTWSRTTTSTTSPTATTEPTVTTTT